MKGQNRLTSKQKAAAQAAHATRDREGHKQPAWEGLAPAMQEELVWRESQQTVASEATEAKE